MIFFNPKEPVKNNKDSKPRNIKNTETISSTRESSFLDILEKIAPSNSETTREINQLWQMLPETEKLFLKEPNQKNLDTYKNLIKDITNAILKHNIELVQARQRGRNDKKILMTVKVIDQNIQILATTMLSTNNSAFHLLKQLDRIRGLLLDLQK
jgi:uncharacterized protein